MQLKKEVSSKELAEKAIQTLQLEMSKSDCENENDLDFRAEDQLDEKGSPALRPLRHFGRTGRRAVVRVEEGEPDVLEVDHVEDSQCSDEQPRIPTKLSTLGQVRI